MHITEFEGNFFFSRTVRKMLSQDCGSFVLNSAPAFHFNDVFTHCKIYWGKIRRAFAEMRSRHADMFQIDRKRRATLIVPHEGKIVLLNPHCPD
jgi:hypothetical protein